MSRKHYIYSYFPAKHVVGAVKINMLLAK